MTARAKATRLGAVTVIAACIFTQNTAVKSGGAVFENTHAMSITYINSLFDRNETTGSTSGEGGGAVFNAASGADFINCTFVNNKAIDGEGGGIRVGDDKNPDITNCIFWDNGDGSGGTTQDESAQIHRGNGGSNPTVTHCTIEGCDTATGGFCNDPDDANKAVEPDFVGTGPHPYQLKDVAANGALIDDGDGEDVAGDCKSVNLTDKDLAGGFRFERKDAFCDTEEAAFVDIGAYEVQFP